MFCGVLFENTNYQDNHLKWTPLGLKVSSIVFVYILFYGSLVQRHCELNFIEPVNV